MGIFLDTIEDNSESEGWRSASVRKKIGILPYKSQIFPSISCRVCQQSFFNDTDLQNHIFYEHRGYYNNIRHNNCIPTKNDKFTKEDTEKLNFADLDNIVFDLQTRINKGANINHWANYKATLNQPNEHPLRKQYLKGMLEYLGAHHQEINEHSHNYHSLSNQFGDAFGYLQPFLFPLAQQTCYSIAFKMNWFLKLTEASEYSVFFWAGHFFMNAYEDVMAITLLSTNRRQTQGIIVDYFHEEFLEALRLFYCNRSKLKYGCLIKLERLLDSTSNPNYTHKLALLKARLFREWGEVSQAKQAYRIIRTHPIFGVEARGF